MHALALIAVLAGAPAAAETAEAERAAVARRLAAGAQQALDAVLGPGRSQVHVEVEGERLEINSETEVLTPIMPEPPPRAAEAPPPEASPPGPRTIDLPGYVKAQPPPEELPGSRGDEPEKADSAQAPQPRHFQKDREQSRRDGGFHVSALRATVVLDSSLDDAAAREASQLAPQVLGIDASRGDAISIVRAPMRPAWRSAFATPADWRAAAYAAGGGAVVLLTAVLLVIGLSAAGWLMGRGLGRELAAGRGQGPELPPPAGEPIPELAPGGAGFLDATVEPAGAPAAAAPLLGRRFDFLAERDPRQVARALSVETAADASLLVGHLAETAPDLASRLFAHLPGELQARVSQELLKLSVADPERLSALEERLRSAVENGVLGPQTLGRLLSRVPGEARADLLGRIAASDSRAAEEVERHVFGFESLEGLDAAGLRRLLVAVPYETWGPALRGAPPTLAERVLADLPEGPRGMVKAAADTPQPREKVVEARSRILDAFSALTAKGDLVLGRAEGGGELM